MALVRDRSKPWIAFASSLSLEDGGTPLPLTRRAGSMLGDGTRYDAVHCTRWTALVSSCLLMLSELSQQQFFKEWQ